MTKHRHSRRTFLAGIGATAAFLPLLEAERARAACLAQGPRRAIFVTWPNATLGWASGGERDFTLPEALSPLEPHREDIILLKGIKYQTLKDTPNPQNADNVGHGTPAGLLTGTRYKVLVPFRMEAGGPSVDQHISNELKAQNKFSGRALHLGIRHEGYQFVWRAAGEAVPPNNDPYNVFDTLFSQSGGSTPDPSIERRRLTRKSVLDRVYRDMERFCKNLSGSDRERCDAHMTSIRELEETLAGGGAVGTCAVPTLGNKVDVRSDAGTPTVFKAQIDLMVAAMASDLARTGVITFGNEGNNHVIPTWLGFSKTGQSGGLGDANSHHSIAHAGGDRKVKIDKWLYEQAAYLIARLKAEPEGDGTMLDNTVVVFTNNMDNGGGHGINNVPWLLAGRCGGAFRTGRNLQIGDVPHTDVLNAVAQAMGVEIDGYTNPEYRGVLSSLK